MNGREFPILRDPRERKAFPDGRREVPWAWVAPYEAQARANHDQTLARLAERGGLGPNELHAIVHGRRRRQMVSHEEGERWLATWDGSPVSS